MFKKTILWIIVIFVLCIILFALKESFDNNPATIIKYNSLENRLLTDYKGLILKVNYLGLIPAGLARLNSEEEVIYQGRRVYHLSAKAESLDFYSGFFNARAVAHSYVDIDRLYTLMFKQTLIRPKKPKDEREVLYDQEKNIMELRGVRRQILPETQDPLSAIFYIQHQVFEIGKEFDLNVNTNQKNYQIYIKVKGRQEYALEAKKIGVWVLEAIIRRRDKNPYHKTTMKLWLLDNPSKTPLLIKAMTSIGQVSARLSAIE